MYLLEKVEQRNTTRNRVDDWILLLLRILLLLALGLAMLRPRTTVGKAKSTNRILHTGGHFGRCTSLSMSQTLSPADDTTVLEWSKTHLMERLKEDQGQRQFELGVFGATVEDVFPDWQEDTVAVSAAVQEVRQGEKTTDIASAIQWARQTLDGKGGEIWLYTDQSGTFSESLKTEIGLLVEQKVSLVPILRRLLIPVI